jgi:hypothetical protein
MLFSLLYFLRNADTALSTSRHKSIRRRLRPPRSSRASRRPGDRRGHRSGDDPGGTWDTLSDRVNRPESSVDRMRRVQADEQARERFASIGAIRTRSLTGPSSPSVQPIR